MSEQIQKLSPHRDLQCFFFQPSAVAALSGASSTGFTVSGTWRQQFDWAVIEWNRDNVYEHPLFRNLPDGDLSGLTLTYDETRDNCIPLDSACGCRWRGAGFIQRQTSAGCATPVSTRFWWASI